jgi:hypothetical protein
MHPNEIPWRMASARAKDIEKIPLAVMKSLRTPGELGLRLITYDALVAKSRRPRNDGAGMSALRQLAREALETGSPARLLDLMKAAGVVGSYTQGELQQMLRAGQAFKLSDGRLIAGRDARDVRYATTIAQGGPEDSAGFRNWLQRRARALGVTLPADWGRPSAPAVSPSTTRQNRPMPGNTASTKSAYEVRVNGRLVDPSRVRITKAGPAAAPASQAARKAAGYRAKAAVVSDPADRAAYLQLAAEAEMAGAR